MWSKLKHNFQIEFIIKSNKNGVEKLEFNIGWENCISKTLLNNFVKVRSKVAWLGNFKESRVKFVDMNSYLHPNGYSEHVHVWIHKINMNPSWWPIWCNML
jgi:hypothetical protein